MAQVFKINNIDYDCEFKLTNSDNQEVEFTKSAIRGMSLVDSIFDPFASATISIANPYDLIEDKYLLRGDGRDEFKISFNPVSIPKEKVEHTFVVVGESSNVNPNVRSENIKTFKLVEKAAIPFSDLIPYNKTYSGKIGEILKDIFKEVLGDEQVDENEWEDGDFEISYTPPSTFRYADLIHYLMKHYYAKDGDLHVKGFIMYDHTLGKYQLRLISKMFEDNKKNILEAFGLGDMTDKVDLNNPNNPPKEAEYAEYIGAMKNLIYSTPLYEWNNNFFVNALVFGYDPILGEQKIRKLKLEDIKESWVGKFVDVFKSKGGKGLPFLTINKTTEKRFKHFRSPYPVEDTLKMVEAEVYNALTFYNLQCSFSNIGATNRVAGKFIDIFKTNDQTLKSDEKILGRWFVTEVRHNFFADTYSNEFFCCKTYVGPESNISDDVD